MTTNLRTNKKFKSLPLLMFAALLLFIAAFIGTISSFANATDEITEDLKGGEELALPADSEEAIEAEAESNADGTITISGHVVERNLNPAAQIPSNMADPGYSPVIGAKIYLEGIDEVATSNKDGYYKFENVPQYYVGHIHAEAYNSYDECFSTNVIYLNMQDTIYDIDDLNLIFDWSAGTYIPYVYAIVNHVEDYDNAGHISSHLTINEVENPHYEVPEEWDAPQARIPYNPLAQQEELNSTNGGDYPLEFSNSKITVNDTELIIEGDDAYGKHYKQVLNAYVNKGYKFDGWYGLKERNSFDTDLFAWTNYDYVKCYTGDYLYDFNINYTMGDLANDLANNNFGSSDPISSDGGPVCFIARFVKDAPDTHTITVQVEDETNGYLTGTLGNTENKNVNSYLNKFQFQVTNWRGSEPKQNWDLCYLGSVSIDKSKKMYNSVNFYDEQQQGGYELNYITHTSGPSLDKNAGKFNFNAMAYDGYAFLRWEVTDKTGNVVPFDYMNSKAICQIDQDLTFTAKFAKAVPISGKVTDSNGNIIEGASLSFNATGNTFNGITNVDGDFTIGAFSDGGILTVAKNNYYVYSKEMSAADVEEAATEGLKIILDAPKEPVYLCGETYELTQGGDVARVPAPNNNENASAASGGYAISNCLISLNDESQKNNPTSVFYQHVTLSPWKYASNEWSPYGNQFMLAVEKGAYGWMTISCEGHNTLKIYIPEDLTDVEAGTDIDFANDERVKLEPDQKGVISKSTGQEEHARIYLTRAAGLSVFVATEDTDKGQIEVVYEDGKTNVVDYTADFSFQYGDIIDVDYLTGELTINSKNLAGEEYTKMRVLPAPNTDEGYEFFGWVAYTDYNERIEIMKANKIVNNLTIYAQYKKVSELNATGGEGHKLFSATFDSNELKHIGHEPYVFEDEEFSFRQYLGSTYTVDGNQLKFAYDESEENPDPDYGVAYVETTTVEAIARDGYEFDHWAINGEDVLDSKTGRIVATDDFDVQAVYKANEEPEPDPDPVIPIEEEVSGGTAQTGDSIPFVAIVICGLVVIAAGTFAIRKYLIKK